LGPDITVYPLPSAAGGQVKRNPKTQHHRGALLLFILGGFGLRLFRLGADSLWYDEAVSALLASKSIPDLVAHTARDIHPPGYYLLLHFWTRLSGDTEFALAFFSVVFGVLLIPLTYALARRLLGRTVALWAALLVTVSPFNLWYSQEVRMYTLGAALGLVTLWCALELANQQISESANRKIAKLREWRWFVGYVLAATTGLYVLYYFGFLLVTLNVLVIAYLLLNHQFRGLGIWLLAQFAVLVLYLAWLPTAWRQVTSPPVPPWRGFIPLQRVLLEVWAALSLGQSVQPSQVWPLLLVTVALFLLGLLSQIGESGNPAIGESGNRENGKSPISNLQSPLLLAAYTFVPLILIYLVSLITPLYHVRYMFTYSPTFYILLGAGLAWLTRRLWPLAAAAILALLVGSTFSIYELHTNPRYAADDLRAAVDFISERWRPGDAILINAGYAYPGFLFYYDDPIAGRVRLSDFQPAERPASTREGPLLLGSGMIGGGAELGWGDPESDFYTTSKAETTAALQRVTQTFPRIWMLRIYDIVTDPKGVIRDWLATNTTPFEDQAFTGEAFVRVQGFMSSVQPPPPTEGQVALESGISLLGWEMRPNARTGKPLDVVLWWYVDAHTRPSDQPYAVSLKLWGTNQAAETYLAAQQDEWPLGGLLLSPDWPPEQPVRHPMRLLLPAELSPGDYRLEVEMYDPVTVQPIPRSDGKGHTISLGSVTVLPNQ
jgi:4-amino-4-deoxy-L-arabinose transferase-like glycosyltransferase